MDTRKKVYLYTGAMLAVFALVYAAIMYYIPTNEVRMASKTMRAFASFGLGGIGCAYVSLVSQLISRQKSYLSLEHQHLLCGEDQLIIIADFSTIVVLCAIVLNGAGIREQWVYISCSLANTVWIALWTAKEDTWVKTSILPGSFATTWVFLYMAANPVGWLFMPILIGTFLLTNLLGYLLTPTAQKLCNAIAHIIAIGGKRDP